MFFRLTSSVITHILKIDEKFKCLIWTIQTYFFKLQHSNCNNIQIWSKNLQIGVETYFCP
jgi:hypothetical protein